MPGHAQDRGRPAGRDRSRKRELWEERYRRRDTSEFHWYREEPPPELLRLLEEGGVPAGAALDLGCGPGVVTTFLADRFRPAVGMDIAVTAVSEAGARASDRGSSAVFVAGEAPQLPFRDASFAFVFDRGCLQAVPRQAWGTYFTEVERLLVPGGALQLYCSRVSGQSRGRARAALSRARRILGRRRAPGERLSAVLTRLLPPAMEPVTMEDQRFRTPAGRMRMLTYAVVRKR
jgi:SAM-dependent methyltransferase